MSHASSLRQCSLENVASSSECGEILRLLAGLRHLPELNTVILKNNSLTALGTTVCGCAALVKLSVAHNDVRTLPSYFTTSSIIASASPTAVDALSF